MRGMRWDIPDIRDQLICILGREKFEDEIKRVKKEWLILNDIGALLILAKERKII